MCNWRPHRARSWEEGILWGVLLTIYSVYSSNWQEKNLIGRDSHSWKRLSIERDESSRGGAAHDMIRTLRKFTE